MKIYGVAYRGPSEKKWTISNIVYSSRQVAEAAKLVSEDGYPSLIHSVATIEVDDIPEAK